MGGGAYTDPYIAPDENYDLNSRLRTEEKFAEQRNLDISRHLDCSRLKRVRGSSGLLSIARKTGPKREEVTYLAAEYFQATNWMINYENGQPVTRTKVVILYFRPKS